MSTFNERLTIPYALHFVPTEWTAPPIVLIPGSSGNAPDYLSTFRPYAEYWGAPLLVPEFGGGNNRGYQRLSSDGRPLGAAWALDEALGTLAEELGMPLPAFDLVGFSGGAQFAHRYALLFPQRVRRLVVGAAGWYTQLDSDRPFPYGPAPSIASDGISVDLDGFLGVDVLVTVGERDTTRGRQLRSDSRLDAEQGENRLSRALNWYQRLLALAERRGVPAGARFEVMPKTGHSFSSAMAVGGFGGRTMRFLQGLGSSDFGQPSLPEPTTVRSGS